MLVSFRIRGVEQVHRPRRSARVACHHGQCLDRLALGLFGHGGAFEKSATDLLGRPARALVRCLREVRGVDRATAVDHQREGPWFAPLALELAHSRQNRRDIDLDANRCPGQHKTVARCRELHAEAALDDNLLSVRKSADHGPAEYRRARWRRECARSFGIGSAADLYAGKRCQCAKPGKQGE